MLGYVLLSIDPGGMSDPTGFTLAVVRRVDQLTRLYVERIGARHPIQTPTNVVDLVQELLRDMRERHGSVGFRVAIDLSSNTGVGHLLALTLPPHSIVAVRISGGDAHGAGVTALPIGEVNGHSTALPCLSLSRREMLLQLSIAFAQRRIILPLEDHREKEGLKVLRDEMTRASLKTTASGRQTAVVARGHDDVVMSLAQMLVVSERLPMPREDRFKRARAERRFSSRAWT